MPKPEPGVGQGTLFVPVGVKAPELPPGFDLDSPVSISRLICAISDHMDLPPDFTNQAHLERVEPKSIESGLYFDPPEARSKRLKNVYQGVGFLATDFLCVARSPADLASHMYARAKKANEKRSPDERLDRDEAHNTASRAAARTLGEQISRLEVVRGELSERRLCLLAVHKALRAPGRAYWKAVNLDRFRRTASDVIHNAIEVAVTNLPWDNQTADDLQDALHYNLYGHAGHNNRRLGYWRRYVLMVGKHTKAQINALGFSLSRTDDEFAKYAPYLEDSEATV